MERRGVVGGSQGQLVGSLEGVHETYSIVVQGRRIIHHGSLVFLEKKNTDKKKE